MRVVKLLLGLMIAFAVTGFGVKMFLDFDEANSHAPGASPEKARAAPPVRIAPVRPVFEIRGDMDRRIRTGAWQFERWNGPDAVWTTPITLVKRGPSGILGFCYEGDMKMDAVFLLPSLEVGETGKGQVMCSAKTTKIVLVVE